MEFVWLCVALTALVTLINSLALVKTLIELKAMQKSTHSVQFVDPFKNVQQEFESITDKTEDKLTKPAFDNIM